MATIETLASSPARSVTKGFLHHYGSTALGQGLVLGLGTVTGILVPRLLGPAMRGELQAALIWPLNIAFLLTFGMNQSISFHLARRIFSISETAASVIAIALTQCALAILLGLVAVHFVLARYSPAVQHVGIIIALFSPFSILCLYCTSFFQGFQDFLRFNVLRAMSTAVYFVGVCAIAFTHRKSILLVADSQLAGYVITFIVGFILVLRVLKPGWKWAPPSVPRLLHYGLKAQLSTITSYVNQRIDQLILSLFIAPRELGLYVVAVTLSTALTVFPQAAGIVTFARGSSQTIDEFKRTVGISFRTSLLWLLACGALLFVAAPFLFHTVFGHAFDGSILACRILTPGAIMIGLNLVLYNGASAMGRPGLPSIAEGISVGITAAGLYLLVPKYGYIGAAIVSTLAYTVTFLTMLALYHFHLRVTVGDLFGFRKVADSEA